MREVKVNRESLLQKVRENREKHLAEYKAACAGYRDQALAKIEDVMAGLKQRIGNLKEGQTVELMSVSFGLPVPQDHTKEYDRAISMLEMCVEPELLIDEDSFDNFVMDNWPWQEQFKTMSARYTRG
jgi:hypothetical protein